MDEIRGIVERITYTNEDDYNVIKIRVKNHSDLVAVVVNMSSIYVGTVITVTGRWEHSAKFGKQFIAEKCIETLPATIHGLEKYLSSGLIKGIGPKKAKLIVNHFGKETIDVIENSPQRLQEIKTLGKNRINNIITSWNNHKNLKTLLAYLQELNISTSFGHRIFSQYGDSSIKIIKENPYQLVDDVPGIGFVTADKIGSQLNIEKVSYSRCRAGILYVLGQYTNNGHCFAEIVELIPKCVDIL